MFKSIDCLLLKVSNLEDGLKFYSETLGHEVVWKTKTAAGMKLPESDTELVISIEIESETDLKVEDTISAFKKLLDSGCTSVVEPFDIAIGKCAIVEDPWRNKLTILDNSKGTLKVDAQKNVIQNQD